MAGPRKRVIPQGLTWLGAPARSFGLWYAGRRSWILRSRTSPCADSRRKWVRGDDGYGLRPGSARRPAARPGSPCAARPGLRMPWRGPARQADPRQRSSVVLATRRPIQREPHQAVPLLRVVDDQLGRCQLLAQLAIPVLEIDPSRAGFGLRAGPPRRPLRPFTPSRRSWARQLETCDLCSPSRRRSAPMAPGSQQPSASAMILALYSVVKRGRSGLSTGSKAALGTLAPRATPAGRGSSGLRSGRGGPVI